MGVGARRVGEKFLNGARTCGSSHRERSVRGFMCRRERITPDAVRYLKESRTCFEKRYIYITVGTRTMQHIANVCYLSYRAHRHPCCLSACSGHGASSSNSSGHLETHVQRTHVQLERESELDVRVFRDPACVAERPRRLYRQGVLPDRLSQGVFPRIWSVPDLRRAPTAGHGCRRTLHVHRICALNAT